MSTFKKVVSLMLCFAMLLGTVAVAGNSIVAPKAFAEGEPVSGIDSYADLAEKYDNFVYLGLEFYEQTEDGEYTLTDYKVQPGQPLRMYFYIKTDMYLGGGNPYIIFDRNFFDVTNGDTGLTYDNTYDPDHADYPTETYPSLMDGSMNPEHSAVVNYGVTVTMTTKWARNVNGFTEKTQTNWHGIDLAESDEWDFVFGSWMRDNNGLTSWEAKDDAYYYSWDIKVREFMPDGTTKLADGTTGFVKNDPKMFKRYDASTVTSKRVSYVAVDPEHINYASMKANNKCDFLTIDSFLLDDCNHTFTIDSTSIPGEYETEGGEGGGEVVVPVSGIDSYADLAATYDNFVYLGLEFYEKTEDGEYTLTDYKVQAGQDLRMYFYIKTDMYLGGGNPYIIFDRNFFDVTNGATTLTYDDAYDANHADYPTENYPSLIDGSMNPEHSAVVNYGVTVTMTTKWARNVNGFTEKTQTNWHGIDLAESDEWDFVFGSWMRDNNGLTSWEAKDDAYYYSWDIKVREFMPDGTTKLADGTTGFVKNDPKMFKRYDASTVTSKRVSYVAVDPEHINYASMKANNKCDFLTIDSFLLDDCNHTFTIDSTSIPGEYGPATAVKTYSVSFTEADGTVVSTGSYAEGAEIDVPAAAENELGWANTKTGVIDEAIVSGGKFTVGRANLTFQRVLTTDKFDVVLNLDGGTIDGETSVTIKAGYGEEVDLNDYIPVKAGYAATWNPSTIKVENINGATAKVTWTAETYTVTFYADEEGTTVSETVEAKYNANVTAKIKPVKEGYKFVGWVDAEGNFASPAVGALGIGRYTKTEDSAYYPSWEQLPCSITIKAKDFVTGEWKVVAVKYGEENATLTSSQLAEIRTNIDAKEVYNWDGDVYYNPANASAKLGPDEATATTIGRNDSITFSGDQIIWIQAEPIFTVEYNIPVFDEATGEYTSEYETFTATTRPSISNTVLVSVSSAAPADGYVFKGWVTADGAAANYSTATTNYIFPVDITSGAKIVVYAQFELKTYDIKFFGIGEQHNANATIIIKDGFRIGDTIDLDAAEYVFDSPAALAGQTAVMPIVGKENSEQPVRFSGRDGYKFTGFYFYKDNAVAELDGITVTEEFVAQYAVAGSNGANDYIQIGATWEAQSYDAVFKYETAEGTKEIVVSVPVGTALATFDPSKDAEQMALIAAGTPEGSVFIRWSYDQELTATGAMVAGGVTYTAIYNKVQIKVFVDYNNGSEPQSLSTVRYGDDTMAVGDETGEGRGIYYVVKTIQLDAYRPTETHESIGWTVYHVHDEADVNDPTKWHEGVNDDGTSEAKYTLIYKNEWKQHGEFFFTLYGTDGKIFCALGKNFKLYYWENRRSCDKDDANFLHNPELLVLFLKPEFVKDESGLCLKLTPFALNRSLFTFENIGALFEALGTLLKSLINGEL